MTGDPLALGLELLLVGMGTVFLFLTLLVLATSGMSALAQRLVPAAPVEEAGDGPSAEELAAISAALHQHRRRGS